MFHTNVNKVGLQDGVKVTVCITWSKRLFSLSGVNNHFSSKNTIFNLDFFLVFISRAKANIALMLNIKQINYYSIVK